MALGFEKGHEQWSHQDVQDHRYPSDLPLGMRNVNSKVPIAMAGSKPPVQSRPHMPDRADAHMRSVPRVKFQSKTQVGFTENHCQWRYAGTSEDVPTEKSNISVASTIESDLNRRLAPKLMRVANQNTVLLASSGNGKHPNETSRATRVSSDDRVNHHSQDSGLMRKCSRCHNGFVAGSVHTIAGQTHESLPATVIDGLKEGTNTGWHQLPSEGSLGTTVTREGRTSVTSEKVVDERDHTACCTECCAFENCHEGCLGHPSPSIRSFGDLSVTGSVETPTLITAEPTTSARSGPSSTTSSPWKGKLSSVQHLKLRKTLRTRQCLDDGKTIKERCHALDSPLTESDSHPLSPEPFWGSVGGGGETAVVAAKKALGDRKRAATIPSMIGEVAINNMVADEAKWITSSQRSAAPKTRELRSSNATETTNVSPASGASRSRNVNGMSDYLAVTSSSRSRNASGASTLSIEVPHGFSSLSTINATGVLQMLRLLVEAVTMWIQTHPEAQQLLWRGAEKAFDMAETVMRTGASVWEVSYIYSKTGKLKCKASGGFASLVMDCGRSAGYLIIFVALALCLGRLLGFVLGLARSLFWVVRVVGWLVKKLGLGLLW